MNTRIMAVKIILGVLNGSALTDLLKKNEEALSIKDRPLLQALCYGVIRHYQQLLGLLHLLQKKSFKSKDQDLEILILIGLYQLMAMRIPPYAAVSETVNCVLFFKKNWAKSLINAMLRRFLREKETLITKLNKEEEIYNHPAWLIEQFKNDWPTDYISILTADNQHPPFSLRVNLSKITRENYIKNYPELSITSIHETASGIILSEALSVQSVPGFKEGLISVQDGAAQLAAPLLMLEDKLSILDACAAPGGKLMHILESHHVFKNIVAVEKDKERAKSIEENLTRLNLNQDVLLNIENINIFCKQYKSESFDRILLDAPCSGSGVIRRHPDIKLLRKKTDLANLHHEQLQMLRSLWPLLKKDGILLYATCSIISLENDEVIEAFLVTHRDAALLPIDLKLGKKTRVGLQILPGTHDMDGFYYARLIKR